MGRTWRVGDKIMFQWNRTPYRMIMGYGVVEDVIDKVFLLVGITGVDMRKMDKNDFEVDNQPMSLKEFNRKHEMYRMRKREMVDMDRDICFKLKKDFEFGIDKS